MSYAVKELFLTLQGEGSQAGRAAVFCRFTGCNLWNGREQDRMASICRFCDTDFIGVDGEGGGRYSSADDLAEAAAKVWGDRGSNALVVCTGGEPTLQLDRALIDAFHLKGFEIAIETNGTLPVPGGVDHICVSPKGKAELIQQTGHELKLVYPQEEWDAQPERFSHLGFDSFFLQPLDGPDREKNTQAAIAYCLNHPQWKLSLQTHKYLGIP